MADAAAIPADTPAKGARLLTLSDLDQRTAAAKAARALINAVLSDLGGEDACSAIERTLATRLAISAAVAEDLESKWLQGRPIDVAAYASIQNVIGRHARTLGLKRRPRDVGDLAEHVASQLNTMPPPPVVIPPPPPIRPPRPPRTDAPERTGSA